MTRWVGASALVGLVVVMLASSSTAQAPQRSAGVTPPPIRQIDHIMIIGATDVAAARRLWQSLLDPIPSSAPDSWQIGNGPAIRLIPATENRIQTLVIRVASIGRATTFLRDKQLLRADPEGRPTIDLSKVGELDFRLVDK